MRNNFWLVTKLDFGIQNNNNKLQISYFNKKSI